MSNKDVAQFFATVYKDKGLQGALNFALAQANPEVVVEIAKQKGFKFSGADLTATLAASSSGELSESELSGAVGGAATLTASRLGTAALQKNFWGSIVKGGFGGVADDPAFGLTIPGPSFVQVATTEARDGSEVGGQGEVSASAQDVYQALLED